MVGVAVAAGAVGIDVIVNVGVLVGTNGVIVTCGAGPGGIGVFVAVGSGPEDVLLKSGVKVDVTVKFTCPYTGCTWSAL